MRVVVRSRADVRELELEQGGVVQRVALEAVATETFEARIVGANGAHRLRVRHGQEVFAERGLALPLPTREYDAPALALPNAGGAALPPSSRPLSPLLLVLACLLLLAEIAARKATRTD